MSITIKVPRPAGATALRAADELLVRAANLADVDVAIYARRAQPDGSFLTLASVPLTHQRVTYLIGALATEGNLTDRENASLALLFASRVRDLEQHGRLDIARNELAQAYFDLSEPTR